MVDEPDTLLADPAVARELGITLMSIWRWDQDPAMAALGWPPKIQIRHRNFRSRRALEAFKSALVQQAIEHRARAFRKRA